MADVLVVEDDPLTSRVIAAIVRKRNLTPVLVASGTEALAALEEHDLIAVCLDLVLPDMRGESVLVRIRERRPDLPVIVLSAQHDVTRAVDTMKLRPFDYVVKPFEPERLERSLDMAAREQALLRKVERLEREVQDRFRFQDIVGHAPRMRQVYDQVEKVLHNRVPVCITGESGTGKELIARAIHYNGTRRQAPFVAINCGAIAESLQESELFGHERGSFTGASAQHRGRFEQADTGTLFLDEVGELSPAVQTRLLRVLQEGEIQRLGGTQTVRVDVRIISATHRDLDALVHSGQFREDLFYRLMVYPVQVPPLSARAEDIPLLAAYFVQKHQKALNTQPATFDADAIDVLCRYPWPGNVRELENVIVRTLVTCGGGTIGVDALPPALVLRSMRLDDVPAAADPTTAATLHDGVLPLDVVEKQAIVHAIRALNGNLSLVARTLGVGRATLYRKLAQYDIASVHDDSNASE